jgi:hypothetical protein
MYNYLIGAACIPFNILKKNLIEMCNNPTLKWPAFSMLLNTSIPNYQDDNIAYTLERIYEPTLLEDQWIGHEYLSFLLLRKEEDKAKEVLKEYLKRHDKDTTTEMLPIADFAYRTGISSEDIITASGLFQTIIKNKENRLLENYIENIGTEKTMAVVGNGPHELGTGNGALIDAHDIVVRFNNYNESPEYTNDYGSKCNILFFTYNKEFGSQNFIKKKAAIFVIRSLYEKFENSILSEYRDNPMSNIVAIDSALVRREIQLNYNMNWPTTGLFAIYFFKKVMGIKLTANDIYGFALKTGHIKAGHYNDLTIFQRDSYHNLHDLYSELRILRNIFDMDH